MRTIHTTLPKDLEPVADALVTAVRETRPEEERDAYPRHPSALVPLAYLALAREFHLDDILTVETDAAARAHAFRKPGRKKAEPTSAPLFADGLDVVPQPEPMAPADVGAWLSEVQLRRYNHVCMPDGRLVKQSDAERETMLRDATQPSGALLIDRVNTDGANAIEAVARIRKAFADIAADAVESGWTVRREGRGGYTGLHLVPPGIELRYQVAPGRTVPALATAPITDEET